MTPENESCLVKIDLLADTPSLSRFDVDGEESKKETPSNPQNKIEQ